METQSMKQNDKWLSNVKKLILKYNYLDNLNEQKNNTET